MASDGAHTTDRRAIEQRAVEHAEPRPGERALAALDRVLAEQPDPSTTRGERKTMGEDFSEATRLLCGYRDVLIQAQRKQGATLQSANRLQELNGVLSAVIGGHYPLGDIPWPQVEQARETLAGLIARS